MIANGTQAEIYFRNLFNDFTAGEIKDNLNEIETDYVIERYYQSSQKHISLRDGENSKRISLLNIDDQFVYLSAESEFKCVKQDIIMFMKSAATSNKNSLITNAFRQSTKDGFESFLELKEVY